MFKKLATQYDDTLSKYQPCPNIADRSYWDHLPTQIQSAYQKLARPYINFTYPQLPPTLFMDYSRNGNRTDYESAYFKRRYALNTLVIAECIENSGRYLDDIINGIFALCEETAWQLPAHNSYIRDTPTHLLADYSRPILDLFACETGGLLATIDYLIGSKLDSISPVIRRRIQTELDNRIITPYLNEHFWWMGHEDEPMNNWTIWCTQSILLTFFTTNQSKELKSQAFQKANESIDYFLNEYGIDGCCDEGAQYYRHAGLCLFNTIEILNNITTGAYSHVYEDEKIKNICAYIHNVHVEDKYYINFADCAAVPGRSGVREFLFAQRTGNYAMANYAAYDYSQSEDPFMTSEINLLYRLQVLQHYSDITGYLIETPIAPPDIFYPSVGLWVVRDSSYTLAVKAGDNDDSHNHNDTGSFTIYKNGQPLFVDIGVETYTAKTFSPNRYDIWTMQSDYHNLPTIHGLMQLAGPNYKATQVEHTLDANAPYIRMDLATAYPHIENISQFIRKVQLFKGSHITIKDHLIVLRDDTSFDTISNLITYEKPHLHNDTLCIGNLAVVKLKGDVKNVEIETLPIHDPRLKQSWDHDLYRIRIHYTSRELTLTVI